MNRQALYIVGAPGSGKTTLISALAHKWEPTPQRLPLAHLLYEEPGVIEIGARRPNGFNGTDALAMNAITTAEAWVNESYWPVNHLLAEGDRLANDRFFTALLNGGWDLTVGWLNTPSELAAERRALRGSRQNEAWVRGRETKVLRLVDRWSERVLEIASASDLAENVVAKALA